MDFEEILDLIVKKSGLNKEEIMNKIKRKQKSLNNLISLEGAAYLVAHELGIDFEKRIKRLEMKNIVSGMRRINVVGKIFRISPLIEFEKNGMKGKVVNIFVSDGTSYVKVPLWNDQAKLIENNELKIGDTVQIFALKAKENVFGDMELILGKYGKISFLDEDLGLDLNELEKKFFPSIPKRIKLKDSNVGKFEVKAFIVKVFETSFFYTVCPYCDSTIKENYCEEHGNIEAVPNLAINCIIDDGTSSLRCIFFKDVAEELINLKAEDLVKLEKEKRKEYINNKILGKELILVGNIRKNKISQELELVVTSFKDVDYIQESKRLLEEIDKNLGKLKYEQKD